MEVVGQNTYAGQFRSGQHHGNGILTSSDGIEYRGEFIHGHRKCRVLYNISKCKLIFIADNGKRLVIVDTIPGDGIIPQSIVENNPSPPVVSVVKKHNAGKVTAKIEDSTVLLESDILQVMATPTEYKSITKIFDR